MDDDDFSDDNILGSSKSDDIEVGFKDFERCGGGRCHPLLLYDFPQDITDLRKKVRASIIQTPLTKKKVAKKKATKKKTSKKKTGNISIQ